MVSHTTTEQMTGSPEWTQYSVLNKQSDRYLQSQGIDVYIGRSRKPNFDIMFVNRGLRAYPQNEGDKPVFWYIGYFNLNLDGNYGGDMVAQAIKDEKIAIKFIAQMRKLLSNEKDPRNNYRCSFILPYWKHN